MPIIRGAPELSDADRGLIREALERERLLPPETPKRGRRRRKHRDDSAPPVQRIGVVFVHGIGGQPPGETLLQWSAPIVRVVRNWQIQHGQQLDPVRRAEFDFSGSTIPVIRLSIPGAALEQPPASKEGCKDYPAQEWILSEAWWAKDVEAPGVGLMLGWLFTHGEFRRILTGVFGGLADNGETGWFVRIEEVLVRLFVVPVTILAPILYGLISLVKLIPVKPLQDGLDRLQLDWWLNEWFGDIRILVADRVQAANVRAKLAKTVSALEAIGCERNVIIAHSGGAIVSYMTLADELYAPDSADKDLRIRVDRLITHGQGIGLAWELGYANEGGSVIADDRLSPGDHLMEQLDVSRTIEWDDFWATHDPAPSGPIGGTPLHPEPAVFRPTKSVAVYNRMSIRGDHGGYWDNMEEFVLPVVRLIETTGGPPATVSRFYPIGSGDIRSDRRRARVRSLARWWAWLISSALGLLALGTVAEVLGSRVLERLGSSVAELVSASTDLAAVIRAYGPDSGPFAVPIAAIADIIDALPGLDFDPGTWVALLPPSLVGFIFLIIMTWLLGKTPIRAWNRWDAAAQAAALNDTPVDIAPGGFPGRARASVVALWVLIVAAFLGAGADLGGLPRLFGS